jgi:hypothetical protein
MSSTAESGYDTADPLLGDAALPESVLVERRRELRPTGPPNLAVLVAGAWFAPWTAGLLMLALARLQGVALAPDLVGALLAASLIAAAPSALLAALRGAALVPLGVSGVLALALGGVVARIGFELDAEMAVTAAMATSGLAALWIGGGAAAAQGMLHWRFVVLALPAMLLTVWLLPGPQGVLLGVALGGAVAGLGFAVPLAIAPPPLRRITLPMLLGLMLVAAVLAPAIVAAATGDAAGPLALALALLPALPGLAVCMLARGVAPFRLGIALLALQAVVTGLALVAPGAPVAAGWIPAEALETFRWALLGAGFLPVFCALVAGVMAGPASGLALLPLGALLALSSVLPGAIGPVGLLLAPLGAIAAAVLAALAATAALRREETTDAVGA